AASGLKDQAGAALACPIGDARVRPALETVGGVGAQSERPRGAADVGRIETGALDQHVSGLLVYLAVLAAHHAGERDGLLLIGDEEHFGRQQALLPVERGESLALARAADDDGGFVAAGASGRVTRLSRSLTTAATGDEMIVERVKRLADFEHH